MGTAILPPTSDRDDETDYSERILEPYAGVHDQLKQSGPDEEDSEDKDQLLPNCRYWVGGAGFLAATIMFVLAAALRSAGRADKGEVTEFFNATAEAAAGTSQTLHRSRASPVPMASRSLDSETGIAWKCTSSNHSVSAPVRVPGVVHEALLEAGVLRAGDPLYRYNELNYSWVAKENWTFSATFVLNRSIDEDSAILGAHTPMLEMSGVDTVASVRVNGKQVARTNSAFLQWRLPLPAGTLREGTNHLEVAFEAPREYGTRQSEAYPYQVPFTQYYNVWSEPSNRNFVRKPSSDFGWDWGPSFIPCGITGNVLLTNGGVALDGLRVTQTAQADGSSELRVRGVLPSEWRGAYALALHAELCFPDCSAPLDYTTACVEHPPRVDDAAAANDADADTAASSDPAVSLHVREPRKWWPRGYGEQPLYELRVALHSSGSCAAATDADASDTTLLAPPLVRQVGFRTVELVQQPAQPPAAGLPAGSSFFFRVNGVDVFAKGTNLIPSHIFATGETRKRWRWLLQAAASANMNMVRVWGGGRYQPDFFYELCDRLGLLVWQELMFACALYPRDESFLQLVAREADEQVTRLATHPSIAVWGANNENEAALRWYEASRDNRDLYVADFVKLYVDTLRPAVLMADEQRRPFVDSSPSNGLVSDEPYVKLWGTVEERSTPTQAASSGDVHYYNYDHDCEDPKSYPPARFISEHGFQSFPSFRVYRNVSAPEDWSRDSELLAFRMRHPNGIDQMLRMIQRHFRVDDAASPTAVPPDEEAFDSYLYLTQLQQARCYETAFTAWRRMRSDPANLMGILYWQLNDIWQGPSWSTIEYDGSLRLAHFAVRRAYAPMLLFADEPTPSSLRVSLVSDLQREVPGEVAVELRRWADKPSVPVATRHLVATAQPSGTTVPATIPLEPLLLDAGASRLECYVRLTFIPDAHEPLAAPLESYYWLAQFAEVELPRASLKLQQLRQTAPNAASLVISSDSTAAFVTAESLNVVGAFSDGAFLLPAGDTRSLTFEAARPFDIAEFESGLRLRSLRDTYK